MKALNAFTLPISGLKVGNHEFEFLLDQSFFKKFEASPIDSGSVAVQVFLDKRPDMLVLSFTIKGKIAAECDRCLAEIDLPISGNHDLIVKFQPEEAEPVPELVFMDREATELDISSYIYEFVCLSVPIIKTYDCADEDPIPCNEDLLDILDGDEEEPSSDNPIWDALKDLK